MNINKLAERQLADFDAKQPGMMFAEGISLSVEDAYAVQAAVAGLREGRGEEVIGYKVGCTSIKIQSQLGIDHCITGRLYDTESHASGATIPRSEFANLAIEGELAVELSRSPQKEDFCEGQIPACVSRVFPVIELHHFVMRGENPSAGELITNNAIHGGIVSGGGLPAENLQTRNLDPSLSIFKDNELQEDCSGQELIRTLSNSLQWLAGIMGERGQALEAGQIILTGSIPSLLPVTTACRLYVETSPFGCVEAHIV